MQKSLLLEILSQPAAPFREHHVQTVIERILKSKKIPHFRDPVGNIVVGAKSKQDYMKIMFKKSREPVRLFIAHMDHPGFHGEKWKNSRTLKFTWHGGSPLKHINGSKVWVSTNTGWTRKNPFGTAVVVNHKMAKSARPHIVSGEIKFKEPQNRNSKSIYGGFEFRKPVWQKGQLLYTKAADDLVGSYAIVDLALKHAKAHARSGNFIGLLTRAEEVGFIGCIGHFELGWLQRARRKVVAISLETSRTLPGALIGKGPVLRQGDRNTVFTSDALAVFKGIANKVLPGKYQSRVMDGGTCEASVAVAMGIPAVGISVPLGNYHNQSFQGGPDSRGKDGPAPEFVHLDDIDGVLKLAHGLMKKGLPWDRPWDAYKKQIQKRYRQSLKLL